MPDSFGLVQLADNIPLGGQFRFTVDGTLTSNNFCLGLAGFFFNFGSDDNNILSLGLSLTGVSLSTSGGKSTITGTLQGVFEDDHHHTGSVSAQVVLIAVLPGAYSQVTMANPPGFASGSTSQQIPLTVESPALTAILSGFSMAYSTSDQSVNQVGATLTPYLNAGNVATLGGTCELEESSKTKATELSLFGGLIADASSSPVFEILTYRAQTAGGNTAVTFSQEVTQAQALLVGFKAKYPGTDTHKVMRLGASFNDFGGATWTGLQSDHKTFSFFQAMPHMFDDENNGADGSSFADYVVIGAVKTQS